MTSNWCFGIALALVVSGFGWTSDVGATGLAQAQSPSASELAADLQKKYNGISTFSADFTHEHEGGVLRRKMSEQGSLQVKKPGRMRWDYKSPEKKLFVSDGTTIYFHDITNNQVTVSQMPQGDDVSSAALFLLGKATSLATSPRRSEPVELRTRTCSVSSPSASRPTTTGSS